MEDNNIWDDYQVVFPSNSSHIKVIGVGGGGCNIVEKIFNSKLYDVDLIISNTDIQALNKNSVNQKLRLGSQTLGAGCNPAKGRAAAISSTKEIEEKIDENTEMVFITACLGGGTGTGAAPVIAEIAKRKGKLVVGVVTIPFRDEGPGFMERAMGGLKELRKHVDSIILIDNQKIYKFGDLTIEDAYSKVDDILVTAVKSISEIVTVSGTVNVDMNDVKWVMQDSGTASIGIGHATIEEGAGLAVERAISSPLLNDCDFSTATGALVVLTCGTNVPMSVRQQVSETVQKFAGNPEKFKLGLYTNLESKRDISVTVVITGFKLESMPANMGDEKIIIDENGKIFTEKIPEKPG